MKYVYKRGKGARRRVMHLSAHDRTGQIVGVLCGSTRVRFDTYINVPLGVPVCKRCRAALADWEGKDEE